MSVGIAETVAFYNDFLPHLKKDHERENPRHKRVKQTLRRFIEPDMKVLDVGCGTGITSRFMGELGAKVTAVDIADKLVEYACIHSYHENVFYMTADVTKTKFDTQFDLIVIVDAFEHIERSKIHDFLDILNHVTPKTRVYLNIPDGRFQSYMHEKYPEKLQIVDNGYQPTELLDLFSEYGFEAVHMAIYGIDAPVQYNEYIFANKKDLNNTYGNYLRKCYNG